MGLESHVKQLSQNKEPDSPVLIKGRSPMMRRENSRMSLMSAGNDGLKINDLNDALEKFTRPNDNEEVIRLKKQFLKSFIKFLTEFLDHIEYVNHIFNLFKKDPNDRTIRKRKILD